MHDVASHHRPRNGRGNPGRLNRLLQERRKLSQRLGKLDAEISRLGPARAPSTSVAELDRWLDELVDGLPSLPPLPADFSRADLYNDHD